MKRLSTLLCFMVIAAAGQAQLRVAVLGGPHSASVKETNSLPDWDTKTKPFFLSRGGFHAGFLGNVPLNNSGSLALQPGVFYMSKGRKFQQGFDTSVTHSDTLSFKSNFFANYIDIPFNIAYKLPLGKKGKFFLSAGPYVGFYFNGKNATELLIAPTDSTLSFSKSEEDFEVGKGSRKMKTVDFGINGRVGFELGGVIISGFYSQGLGNFFQADYDATYKHQVFGASLGFWLNKAAAPAAPKVKDRDNDGVPDGEDACPTIPGSALAKGCPDRDGDGIADQVDKCPDVAGVAAYNGCPIPDTDKDGVNDKKDECPTEAGTKENKGCPVLRKAVIEQVNFAARNILFQSGSVKVDARSYASLNEVATILKNNPQLRLTINGYTDNTGSVTANQDISQKRADAVKKYLNEKGIAIDRLTAKGYGPADPIADNTTEEGRVKNRRVELKLQAP